MSRVLSERESVPHFVYRYYDADGTLLYVGVTIDPKQRHMNHGYQSPWFRDIASYRLTGPFISEDAGTRARAYERQTIFNEHPLHNVNHQMTIRHLREAS